MWTILLCRSCLRCAWRGVSVLFTQKKFQTVRAITPVFNSLGWTAGRAGAILGLEPLPVPHTPSIG